MNQIAPTLAKLAEPVESLTPSDRNPRRGNVGELKESLKAHGQYRPIVVNRPTPERPDGEILRGNHTWRAAKALDWDQVAVIWLEVSDADAHRIIIADNRTSDLATYDQGALLEVLLDLSEHEGLQGTGYTDKDLESLLADLSAPMEEAVAGAVADDWEQSRERWQPLKQVVLLYSPAQHQELAAAVALLQIDYEEPSPIKTVVRAVAEAAAKVEEDDE